MGWNGRVRISNLLPSNALVAQSVEQRIENPCVGGSIPSLGTNLIGRLPTLSLDLLHTLLHYLGSMLKWQGDGLYYYCIAEPLEPNANARFGNWHSLYAPMVELVDTQRRER
jgi:hypothetical protein